MNALVIAQHHGAFLTIESLLGKVEEIVVVIPRSQIEKYSKFPEPEFFEYEQNMREYCKKKKIRCWIAESLESPAGILESLDKKGKWVVLLAGSIYQKSMDESKLDQVRSAYVRGRLYDNNPRLSMYKMLGMPETDNSPHKQNFFLNMDVHNNRELSLYPMAIGRADPLIGQAISSLECLRIRSASSKSMILSYWMQAISKKNVEQEFVAYPFDEYATLAKKVKKYLPKATYSAIEANGIESKQYRAFADLEL